MGITISLIAIVALVLISWIGSSVPGLQMIFAVIIPIASIAFFLIGILARVFKWASAPVPFNITTTAGQQKSHDWIKQNKLDSPSGFWGVVGRMALEVLFFRSLFRNTKAGILDKGSKLVYGAEKWLWAFALAFHWSFLIIVLRHFRFFTEPAPFFVDYLQIYDSFFQIEIIKGYKDKFFVNINCINCETSIDSCWINKKNAGIGLRNKTINFIPIYNEPEYDSKIKIVNIPIESILARLVDIKDLWVKITFEFKNKKFIGWLAPENQCINLFTMCLGE